MTRGQSGFTLLEVMVAVTLLAVVVTLLYYSFTNAFLAVDETSETADSVRTARQVTSRVTRELEMAYLSQQNVQLAGGLSDLGVVRWGFVGTEERVDFTSIAHTKYYKDFNESDQCELGYFLERDPKHRGLYRLMRRLDTTLDEDFEEGGRVMPIADRIKEIQFRYYDHKQEDWYGAWDTNRSEHQNRLPYAVEMRVTIVDRDDREKTHVTKTLLRMAETQVER